MVSVEFGVGVTEGLVCYLSSFIKSDYQALLQLLLNIVTLPVPYMSEKDEGKEGKEGKEAEMAAIGQVEPFGKTIAVSKLLPLIFDLLLLSTNTMRRDVLKDMNYLLVSASNVKNYVSYVGQPNWQDWLLPLLHRIPHLEQNTFEQRLTKKMQQNKKKKHPTPTTQQPPQPRQPVAPRKSKWGALKGLVVKDLFGPDELQKELKTLILNVFSMIHIFIFRHPDYKVDRVLNTGTERLKRFVGDALTPDVVHVTRMLLLSLVHKVMMKKNIMQWRDNFNSDEWDSLFCLVRVVKNFLFKQKIHNRLELEDEEDYYMTCTPYELFGERCVAEITASSTTTGHGEGTGDVVLRCPKEGRSMLRKLNKQVSKQVQRAMNATKQSLLLSSIGLHLDAHTFHCLDAPLINAVCAMMTAVGYKERGGAQGSRQGSRQGGRQGGRQGVRPVGKRTSISKGAFAGVAQFINANKRRVTVEHVLTSSMVGDMKRNEQDRRAFGAEIVHDFRDIQTMFQQINSIGNSGGSSGDRRSTPTVQEISDLFESYMVKSKKRSKIGLISTASKKQVVKQLRGGLHHMKARKMIKAQQILHVEKAKTQKMSKSQVQAIQKASALSRQNNRGGGHAMVVHVGRSSVVSHKSMLNRAASLIEEADKADKKEMGPETSGGTSEAKEKGPNNAATDAHNATDATGATGAAVVPFAGAGSSTSNVNVNALVVGHYDCHKCGLRMPVSTTMGGTTCPACIFLCGVF